MIQPTDYEFSTANTSDAEIVRRFLAKAYGDDHPAMEALRNVERDTLSLERALRFAKSKAYSDFLDRTRSSSTLHGDFGAMEFTAPTGSNPSTTTTTA